MEFNELMIGDYVRYIGTGSCDVKNGDIVKVYALQYPRYVGIGDNCIAYGELFEPIPLTAEILEKNGYKLEVYGRIGIWDDERTAIEEKTGYWEFTAVVGKEDAFLPSIRYVHELQHALRLCGIDKTIEL